jgi:glycosyltransferase involved in cell wall biosynthesis
MTHAKFTFCIPNLNKIQFLPACIESILAQDCTDWRCVFIDGFSTDGSWEYMQRFAEDSRFILRRGIKQGMYADWNECLKYVDTEYFYFLTSDDTCYPKLVSKTISVLDTYPAIDACHFKFNYINELGQVTKTSEQIIQEQCNFYSQVNDYSHIRDGLGEFFMHFAYRAIYITITALVFRSALIEKLQGFKVTCGPIGDYDWTMRMGLHTDVLYIPETLATWRLYDAQATRQTTQVAAADRLLKVAQENLETYIDSSIFLGLKNYPAPKQLLHDFHIRRASGLLTSIMSSETPFATRMESLWIFFQSYPLYIPKKLVNRISTNRMFSYPNRTKLAMELMQIYGLNWPPQKV